MPDASFSSFLYLSSLAETEIPFFATEVTTPSSTFAVSLARHLHSIGAKMYGAFWCSHCLEQKQVIGPLQFLYNLSYPMEPWCGH